MEINTSTSKLTAFLVTGVSIFAVGLIALTGIAAQSDEDQNNFNARLAEELGLPEETVTEAVAVVKEEFKAERQAEMQAKIDEAVANGDLTERQSEILKAMQETRSENDLVKPALIEREAMRDLTIEEREAQFETFKSEMQQQMIDALNEKGLNVTADELEALHETMRDLDLGFMGGRGHHRGGMMF